MTQADARNTTNPSRRRMLATLAAAAVPSTAGAASALCAGPDPIFAAIEAHRAAMAALNAANAEVDRLEAMLPAGSARVSTRGRLFTPKMKRRSKKRSC
jgi:hypothetical protein